MPLHIQAFPNLNAITVVSRSTLTSPPSHFLAVSELLWRSNKTLTVGNFELDPDAGTILYRATNLFPPGPPHEPIITGLVHAAIAEMDRLTPYLAIVLRTSLADLATQSIAELLQNEDLIPPPPDAPADGDS
ncbi:MAG: hypothetical protein P8J87_15505 [Verrucomicrobiales bacterium]|nr:hypothetical protein [Verrucomicrobiales bacterium]